MYHAVENYDYASIPEGKVTVHIAPAVDLDASLIPIAVDCTHYRFHGQTQARFQILRAESVGVYYLDLADYVILGWSDIDEQGS